MTFFFLFAIVILLLALVPVGLGRTTQHDNLDDSAWLPPHLRRARLAYSEQVFRCRNGSGLAAVIDRAYLTPDGHLVLVEFKTRRSRAVYFSDIVELSAQRYAIERASAHAVDGRAYVVLIDPIGQSKHAVAVRLLGAAEVERLADHHRQILTGAMVPAKANHAPLCRQCAYRGACQPTVLEG